MQISSIGVFVLSKQLSFSELHYVVPATTRGDEVAPHRGFLQRICVP